MRSMRTMASSHASLRCTRSVGPEPVEAQVGRMCRDCAGWARSSRSRSARRLPMSAPTRPLALVTGASSGIGFELAKQFAEHGYDLIIAAEDVELDDATAELKGLGVAVAPVSVDLTRREDVERLPPPAARAAGPP